MESLYTSHHIEINYDINSKILYCEWTGFQTREDIQFAGGIILQLVREKSVKKILNNNTEVTGPWNDATQWTRNEWFPDIITAGVTHFAWVISTNPFAELSAKKAMPATSIIKEFENYPDAHAWINSIE